MTTPHKYAALINQWVEDTSQKVWIWGDEGWHWNKYPMWQENFHYAIGDKPTHIPSKMCVLGGLEFPMPLSTTPEIGYKYFLADVADRCPTSACWAADRHDERWLAAGLVHHSEWAAQQHINAMCAANRQAIESVK